MNIEKLTVKQICNCLSMIMKLKEEKIIDFNINDTTAYFDYNEASIYLEKQNIELKKEKDRLNNIIVELEKWIRNYIDLLVELPDIIEQEQIDILYEVLDMIKELKEGK